MLENKLLNKMLTENEKKWGITYAGLAWAENAARANDKKIKQKLKYGESLLHVGGRGNPEEILITLLKCGYNVNALDKFNQTPLFGAIQNGQLDICRILLDAGANPNHQDINGNTPLIAAVNANLDMKFKINIEIIKLLLKSDAKINLTNNEKETPLKAACQSERPEIVSFLKDQGALLEND